MRAFELAGKQRGAAPDVGDRGGACDCTCGMGIYDARRSVGKHKNIRRKAFCPDAISISGEQSGDSHIYGDVEQSGAARKGSHVGSCHQFEPVDA